MSTFPDRTETHRFVHAVCSPDDIEHWMRRLLDEGVDAQTLRVVGTGGALVVSGAIPLNGDLEKRHDRTPAR